MEDKSAEQSEEFDPSSSEEFLNHLDKAFDIEITEFDSPTSSENRTEALSARDQYKEITAGQEEIPLITLPEEEFRVNVAGVDELRSEITDPFTNSVHCEPRKKNKDRSGGKKKKIIIIAASFAGVFALFLMFLFGTKTGQRLILRLASNYVEARVNYDDGIGTVMEMPENEWEEAAWQGPKENTVLVPTQKPEILLDNDEQLGRHESYAVNILILGEEAIGSNSARGRTDLIILATMNIKEKSFKLTTLMRDLLVDIPRHGENKLNAAYQIGGISLLYETIERNFDVRPDGYFMVGFDDFEMIVDKLGGIDISLTKEEADYLNAENYVTYIKNRNLKQGLNHMNGDQALGYCRVRYVSTGTEANDFGRTYRQRAVLNAIFEKYKAMNALDLLLLIDDCLQYITTDIRSEQLSSYLESALDIGLNSIQNFRVPADGTYTAGYVRQMSVIVPDLLENVTLLHEFIFGDEKEEE